MSKTYLEALTSVGKNLQSGIDKLKETKVDWINVVEKGIDNTGTTEVSSALQTIINDAAANSTIYFPTGVYKISTGLVINKKLTIKGNSRHLNDAYPYGASIIRVADGISNITAMTVNDVGLRCSIEGLTFYSTSMKINHVEGTAVGLKYVATINQENVNGLIMGSGAHYSTCTNVFAWGFSGTGIALAGDGINSNICACHCGTGIVVPVDCGLTNFRSQFCEYGMDIYGGATITNGRVEEISKFAIRLKGVSGGNITNVVIDQVGYAAICFDGTIVNHHIDARIVRCCSFYYGKTRAEMVELADKVLEAFGKIYISSTAQVSNCEVRDSGTATFGLDDGNAADYTPFFLCIESSANYGVNKYSCNGIDIESLFSMSSSRADLTTAYKNAVCYFTDAVTTLGRLVLSNYIHEITFQNLILMMFDKITLDGNTWRVPEYVGQLNITNKKLYMSIGLTVEDWKLVADLST